MTEAPSRDEAMLARLAELDLLAAEKAHAKLMAAEEPCEIAELGRTYQRLARSCRQTIALKAKLAREAEAATRPPPATPEPPPIHNGLKAITPAQRAHIERAAATARLHLERERPDWDEFDDIEVYEILLELAQDEAFTDTPVEDLVATVLEAMDLTPPSDETRPSVPAAAAPAPTDTG